VPKVSDAYKEDRRRLILDAAATCFATKGFPRTSMADIVAESGLSPGAIYGYFSGKAEIVGAIAQERHAHEDELVTVALASSDLRQGLRQVLRNYLEWLKDPKEQQRRILTVQVWAESLFDEELAATMSGGTPQRVQLTAAIAKAQRAGQLPKTVDPEALSRLLLAVLQGFVLQQARDPDIDVEAYARTAEAVIDGLFAGD
jgi:AcrR family transcriptional regulator